MKFEFTIADSALEDMADVWTFYQQLNGEESAQRLIDEVFDLIEQLKVFPEMGNAVTSCGVGCEKFVCVNILSFMCSRKTWLWLCAYFMHAATLKLFLTHSLDAREVKSDNIRGILASPDQVTLSDYADRWLKQIDVREVTRDTYKYELGLVMPMLGKKRLKELEPTDIKNALTKLSTTSAKRRKDGKLIDTGKPLSSRTVSHARGRLKTLLREAVTDQIIYVSPAEAVKPIKKHRTERPHIALDFEPAARLHEIGTALFQAGVCRLWVAVFTAVSIGLRRSEVMGLRWQDVDLEKSMIQIRHTATVNKGVPNRAELTKTSHSKRDILIPPSLKAALEAHRQMQLKERETAEDAWQNTGAVFATKTGEWVHPDNFERAVSDIEKWSSWEFYNEPDKRGVARGHRMFKAIERPGIEALIQDGEALPHLTPHDLRHTYATLALRSGVPVEVVSKNLGHADIATTYRIYRHVLDSEKRQHVIDLFSIPVKPRAVGVSPLN
jgi:integrase